MSIRSKRLSLAVSCLLLLLLLIQSLVELLNQGVLSLYAGANPE